jgi:hypothetical protein
VFDPDVVVRIDAGARRPAALRHLLLGWPAKPSPSAARIA